MESKNKMRGGRHPNRSEAFTLAELLVVLMTFVVLTMLLLPALAGSRQETMSFQCLSNHRQLALAWSLYASDNLDKLMINNDQSSAYLNTPNWVSGLIDWSISVGSANTNTQYLTDSRVSSIAAYLEHSTKPFHCPADNFVSAPQQAKGWTSRIRSVVMNAAVGDGTNKAPTSLSYLNPFYYAKKMTDFHNPVPSGVYLTMDEHPDSIDDGITYTSPRSFTYYIEIPASLHDGACGVSFADGRAEMHHWQGKVARRPVKFFSQNGVTTSTNDPDIVWLGDHTPSN